MIVKKIERTGTSRHSAGKAPGLLLFFAGWGMDERPFMEYLPADRDCLVCYDYRSLDFDRALADGYPDIRVVAWSVGVWAASQALKVPVTESVAVNGTVYPVDDERGINRQVFQGTLDGLDEHTLRKFRRRMCGSRETLDSFLRKAPGRSVEDLREELRMIGEMAKDTHASPFPWNRAYIGARDRIFTPANQRNGWEGTNIHLFGSEHYPEDEHWKQLFRTGKING